jgi:alpha-glucosidase
MWWKDAVVYEVYVRSFQDSDGDGIGDLRGVTSRLEHIAGLGAAAVWLSPIFPSPNADFGYDVSDYTAVEPTLGTLGDLAELIRRAHQLGLRVLLDFVPCHTSVEHRWFREHPDYYVWADAAANNWRASFGGSSWELDPVSGRYYLHSFFPEQADLNWRNPHVRAAMSEALRFWLELGVDGFRLDALDRLLKDEQLRDDPPASGPPALPAQADDAALQHTHSRNAPDIGSALRTIRDAVGDALLVGEVYLPESELAPYLQVLDVVFAFEALHATGDPQKLRAAIAAALDAGKHGWVLSNHDFSRLVTRAGRDNARAVGMLTLSLPGPSFLFQGDEIGVADGRLSDPPLDRYGRDAFRLPMAWDTSANGGFSSGTPWLRSADPIDRTVAAQELDPSSELTFYRRLIALRAELGPRTELLASARDTIVVERGEYIIAVNLGCEDRPAPAAGQVVLEALPGDSARPAVLPAHGGWTARIVR